MAQEQTVQLSAWQKLLKLASKGTKAQVGNARRMFTEWNMTGEFNGSQLDMTHCATTQGMFYQQTALTKVTGTFEWGFRHLIDASHMFEGCTQLTEIEGMGNWNMSNVILMDHMFSGCESLNVLDMSHWDLSSLQSAQNCFYQSGVKTLYINGKAYQRLMERYMGSVGLSLLDSQFSDNGIEIEDTKIYKITSPTSITGSQVEITVVGTL